VSGLTCGRIAGARVDLWHADARGTSDASGFRWRGHQVTDADGRYAFETIVPGASRAGAPRLNLRVEIPRDRLRQPGRSGTLMTALFFPADPRNGADPVYRPELLMKTAPGSGKHAAYVFDVILDL
jgi:protocatechuate 3,4-dioxygenase beta subunit